MLEVVQIVPDDPDPLITPKSFLWLSQSTFDLIRNQVEFTLLRPGHVVMIENEKNGNKALARVLLISTSESLTSAQKLEEWQCTISTLVSLSLDCHSKIENPRVKILKVILNPGEQSASIASSATLSFYPWAYPHQLNEPLDTPPVSQSMAQFIATNLLPNTFVLKNSFFAVNWYHRTHTIYVVDAQPTGSTHAINNMDENALVLKETTKINFVPWSASVDLSTSLNPAIPDLKTCFKRITAEIAGLDDIVKEILDLMFEIVKKTSTPALPRGYLFTGVSGTGKTQLASLLLKHTGLASFQVNASDLFASGEGETEESISRLFNNARRSYPSLIVIDDLEAIASTRRHMSGIIEKRALARLLFELDKTSESLLPVFIIGITASVSQQDASLLRSGKLEKVFRFSIPSPSARREILAIQMRKMPENVFNFLKVLTERTPGFTGSDLSNLCRESLFAYFRRIGTHELSEESDNCLVKFEMDLNDFKTALSIVKASALSEFTTHYKKVSFDELQGIDDIILQLKASVLMPFAAPDGLEKLGGKPPKGVLLYGPPGVGKSKLAMALASSCNVNFLTVNSTKIISKIVGQSETALKKVFTAARAAAPAILFLDHIESIARNRGSDNTQENSADRILSLLLTEMDGIGSDDAPLLILAATNKPELLDSAALRPGRFDNVIFVPPPTLEARQAIIRYLAQNRLIESEENVLALAKQTRGFSGADLENLFNTAAYRALKNDINTPSVTWEDVNESLKTVSSSLLRVIVTHPYNKQNTGFIFYT